MSTGDAPSRLERAGVVVVRIWLEDGNGEPVLRARISIVRDLESDETETVAAASAGEIFDVVRRFVDSFAALR